MREIVRCRDAYPHLDRPGKAETGGNPRIARGSKTRGHTCIHPENALRRGAALFPCLYAYPRLNLTGCEYGSQNRSVGRVLLAVVIVTVAAMAPLNGRPTVVAAQGQNSAEWVARQVRDRNQGRDSRSELRMRLFDRQGRVRERVLTMLTLQGEKGR